MLDLWNIISLDFNFDIPKNLITIVKLFIIKSKIGNGDTDARIINKRKSERTD